MMFLSSSLETTTSCSDDSLLEQRSDDSEGFSDESLPVDNSLSILIVSMHLSSLLLRVCSDFSSLSTIPIMKWILIKKINKN